MERLAHKQEDKWINTVDIKIDDDFQRRKKSTQVKDILADFNPDKVRPLLVSAHDDGTYLCLDGQTTMTALKVKNNNVDLPVKCTVFYGLTRHEEAEMFYNQDENVERVKINDKLRVRFKDGDADVVSMVKLSDAAGIKIDFNSSSSSKNVCCAVNAVWKAYNKLGKSKFFEMMMTTRNTWNGSHDSLCGEIIRGMRRLYEVYGNDPKFKSETFIKKLSTVPPRDIIKEGKGTGSSGDNVYARIMLRYYNSKSRNKIEDRI